MKNYPKSYIFKEFSEYNNEYNKSYITSLIDSRIVNGKKTIISTNLSIEELTERYTPRVTSRIIGCYTIKQFKGSDIRQQKRIEEVKRGKNNDWRKNQAH